MNRIKELRARLKSELGYNARKVTVRASRGSAIEVTIRAKGVDYAAVEKLAHEYETIHRCHITHDILSGGNTFVFVRLADKLVDEVADTMPLPTTEVVVDRCTYTPEGDHFVKAPWNVRWTQKYTRREMAEALARLYLTGDFVSPEPLPPKAEEPSPVLPI